VLLVKQGIHPVERNHKRMVECGVKRSRRPVEPGAPPWAGAPEGFRRLKWNEVVCRGDFVADEHRGFEPWEGPGGFQADSFVKPIYRRAELRPVATQKLE
jgi:hypothetical protein